MTQPMAEPPRFTPKILESRHQYRFCHIRLPGEDERMAAISVNGKYYSLLKVSKDPRQAMVIGSRLMARGNEALLTRTAKGIAIWRLELDAIPDAPKSKTTQTTQASDQAPTTPSCKIFNSPSRYQTCYVRVPDLGDRLKAILVDGNYYGLFKTVSTRQQALELAGKLGRRGDSTIITKADKGDDVWVLEPDAQPDLQS